MTRARSRSTFSLLLIVVTLTIWSFAACGTEPPPPTPTPEPTPSPTPIPPTPTPVRVVQSIQPASGVAARPQTMPPGAFAQLPSISALVDSVEPSVASIHVKSVNRGVFFDFTDEGAGSGIIVRPDGYVVTNFHVIQGVVGISVSLPSGQTYDAEVVGWDVVSDLAVLKIETDEPLQPVTWGNSNDIRVGDWVVALGNALALKGGPTVTLGIISALGRTIRTEREPLYDMIQTDAAINDGNSGGPLMNLNGEVIGINTAILRQAQGIGFAIGSEAAIPLIDSLIEHGRVVRPLMGLSVDDVTPALANYLGLNVKEGVVIIRLASRGPAFNAGLQVGDVIISMDGIPTVDSGGFLTMLWTYEVGDTIHLEFVRENKTFETTVELEERP